VSVFLRDCLNNQLIMPPTRNTDTRTSSVMLVRTEITINDQKNTTTTRITIEEPNESPATTSPEAFAPPSDRRSYAVLPVPRHRSVPTLSRLVRTGVLKFVDPDTLELHERECSICATEYETTNNNIPAESPVRLRCNHVIGQNCILNWLTPEIGGRVPTCPLCRNPIFNAAGRELPTRSNHHVARPGHARVVQGESFEALINRLNGLSVELEDLAADMRRHSD